MNKQSTWLLGLLCSIGALSAHAEIEEPWIARVGYANAAFSPSATLSLAGNPVPGAEVKIPDKWLPLLELGYTFADGWVARIALAPPPTVTVFADGSLKGFTPPLSGTIGKARIAPVVMTPRTTRGPPCAAASSADERGSARGSRTCASRSVFSSRGEAAFTRGS